MLIFVFFQMTAVFMGTVREVEEAKSAEQKLIAENAALDRVSHMKSDLLATLSHETRTPLAVLSGYAELISMELRRKGVDEQTASDLDKIAVETQRLAGIMEEMQKLSLKRDSAIGKSPTNLSDILTQTSRLYTPILQRKRTKLVLEVQEPLPLVLGNANELTQVMFNLLSNAGKHTENGEVVIRAAAATGADGRQEITVEVSDTGDGIREEFISQAFDARAHDDPEGTGLGLYICREIILSHEGDISIESSYGQGTTVRFTLQASKEALV